MTDTPEVVVADAGYWHQAQMESIVSRGSQVLIAPDAGKRKGARPGWDGGLRAFMRRVLETERGGELYGKRQAISSRCSHRQSSTGASTASNAAEANRSRPLAPESALGGD